MISDNSFFVQKSNKSDVIILPSNYVKITNDKPLKNEFMKILNNGEIKTVFQPIVSLTNGNILGFEALTRPFSQSKLADPTIFFDVAKVYDKLWELEFLTRVNAMESFSQQIQDLNIFINVDPEIINDEKFKLGFTKEFLKKLNIKSENVIFEITERNTVTDFASFNKTINHYKNQGYRIAIDDTGAGFSGLKLITDIHPYFIKIDMSLIRDIDKDSLKASLVKTLHNFCQITDIKVIAEGIETIGELTTLIDMGIEYGQGYFIQFPKETIGKIDPKIVNTIKDAFYNKSKQYNNRPSSISVGDICRKHVCISSNDTGSHVSKLFSDDPLLSGLPVVDDEKLIGLVMREKFHSKLATQYGFNLFSNRHINLMADKRPLTVDIHSTLDVVSKLATSRTNDSLYDYIVVTKDEKYYGILSVRDLLDKTTEMEINYAKHLNPLTGLPGNVLIEKKLNSLIKWDKSYIIIYIDIDNFKAYNDVYGFENGDKMITFLARIINNTISSLKIKNHFIGHIGGDDFIFILEDAKVDEVKDGCNKIVEAFEKGKIDFFNEKDVSQKCFVSKNRNGESECFGLTTISIAGVNNQNRKYDDIYQLSEHASKIKKQCKQVWDNCIIID